jgi:uncharacterized protein with von Willebrand factor type A (vWA) domain
MAAIIEAMENKVARNEERQFGENGHAEYTWSSVANVSVANISVACTSTSVANVSAAPKQPSITIEQLQELITQFQFQLVRKGDINTMKTQLNTILTQLTANQMTQEKKELLVIMYKLIGQTRDIHNGKGEYNLANMMILEWFNYYPSLARYAVKTFVETNQDEKHKAFGSWKDIKYLCLYIKNKSSTACTVLEEAQGHTDTQTHPLIQYCTELINKQLKLDDSIIQVSEVRENSTISLAAKWTARQTSGKFGWLNKPLAEDYFKEYMLTAKSQEQQKRASMKCQTHYRKLLSKLNKHLDTIQIKQCAQTWTTIDHAKTTSITLKNQTKALLNITKKGEQRSEDPDRVACAEKFKAFVESQKKEGKEMKGSKVGLEQFTVKAFELLGQEQTETTQQEIDILNSQWRDSGNKNNTASLGPMFAMVDRSGSMSGEPEHVAIALGCRIAEKSSIGKCAISFASNPEFISLAECPDFVSMVQAFVKSPVGYSTNFYAALDLILNTIERNQIPADEVGKMVLVLLSDMQINECIREEEYRTKCEPWLVLYERITTKYAETGMRLYGAPLPVPHILFWNLRYTDGFPTLSTQENATMMSGFNSQLLNEFCDKGIDALREYTPWSMFVSSLNKPEYQCLEDAIRQELA